MIPAPSEHQIHASPAPTVDFSINKADAVRIMTLLRNTLYSDKVAAVIREYSANAWDAHREAGKADVPIRVRMPTTASPVFEVRDYGRGIPHEQMESRFCSFGASTKRETNDAVGCFGIGCKSGWAYSKSFTVISRNGGRCCTYVAALDPSGQGQLRLLLAPDPQQLLITPGTTIILDKTQPVGSYEATAQRVTCSRYWSNEREAFARVWLADPNVDFLLDDKLAADRIHSGFAALAVAATRKTDWYRTFQGRVVTQRGDGTLDVTLDQVMGETELPPIRGAAVSAPVGGASLTFQSGDRVAVYFEGGDFRRPRAAMAEQGVGTLAVARVTDTVGQAPGLSTWWPLVKSFAVAFAADPLFATFSPATQSAVTALAAGQVVDPIGSITSGSPDIKLRK